MKEFCRQAAGLIELFDFDPMTEDDLIAWYAEHQDELSEKLTGKRRNTMVLRSLTRFKDQIHIERLVTKNMSKKSQSLSALPPQFGASRAPPLRSADSRRAKLRTYEASIASRRRISFLRSCSSK